MRKVTLNGGPLAGKRYLIPDDMRKLSRNAHPDGHYVIDGDTGTWTISDEALGDASAAIAGPAEPVGLARLAAKASTGYRALIVARTRKRAVELWNAALPHVTDAARITRSNGNERVRFPNGGLLVPVGLNSKGGRGMSADVLYVDRDVADEDLTDILPALAASEHGSIVHHEGAE
ncbi:hypothetical protein IT882_13050 [Microbacterium schleiferi]|uniref:Uncharacterized protein n=1 Tax=Microbacterium schleiferi TaxID=69362 RepID=A0A7S8MVV0_9MICO|nr:hypothetical protein [Microbacterium schleiferi]QPE04119.1 hypothetical protein IT882_13050 [Microbacterium schleiferi]